MVGVRNGLAAAVLALLLLLATLATGARTGPWGWAVGLGCGVVLATAAGRAAVAGRVGTLGPADLVTLTRATLACGVAAMVADSFAGGTAGAALVGLAVVALVLDLVDGRVARCTGTASAFGARLDGEADAFLMLVLSVYVAQSAGGWVLAMGAARYVFAAAGRVVPWMRAALPPRPWRKVVTAVAGTALAYASADLGPAAVSSAALATAFVLLAESFGRDVWWLRRRRVAERRTTGCSHHGARPQRQPST